MDRFLSVEIYTGSNCNQEKIIILIISQITEQGEQLQEFLIKDDEEIDVLINDENLDLLKEIMSPINILN